jgi:hypothetical protein
LQLQCLNPDDSIPTGQFLSTDGLTAELWQGAADAPLLVKSSGSTADIAWISATNAQWSLALHPADTSSLAPGVYYLEAVATRGSDSAALLPKGTTLTLTAAPGTTAVRPTYIDVTDLRRLAGWIDDFSAPDSETGFLEQCADARAWLDENIIRNYRGGNVELLGMHGLALDAWYTGGARRSSLRNPWIVNLLGQGPAVANRNGGLIVTPRTRDICAFYALHRICAGIITRGTQYAALAARMEAQAQRLLSCYTAEISVAGAVDYWGNLLAQIPVNFSSTNVLWA